VNIAADLRRCLSTDFGQPNTCTLPGGAVVPCLPSVASNEDTLGGESIIAGQTRVLRIAVADAPTLQTGQTGLMWNAKTWRAIKVELAAGGNLLRVFLGTP
jgi:hypothetical protein